MLRLSLQRERSYGTTSFAERVHNAETYTEPLFRANFPDALTSHGKFELPCSPMDPDAFASELQRCTKTKSLFAGRSCHDQICRLALDSSVYLQSLLVEMYAAFLDLHDAMSVFVAFNHQHHQSFIWNHIIAAIVHHRQFDDALHIFACMVQRCIIPDKFTFIHVLSLFTSKETLLNGKFLHTCILNSGLHNNIVLATALITMYQKCGRLDRAWSMFERIVKQDEVSWTSIIAAYVQHGHTKQAIALFDLMLQEGFGPSKVAFACIVDACTNSAILDEGKLLQAFMVEYDINTDRMLENSFIKLYGVCGSVDDAFHVYNSMQSRDVVASNTLISAYSQHGTVNQAFHIFDQLLKDGFGPNKVTFLCILDACANATAEDEGKRLHHFIVDTGFDKDIMLETKLVKMYGKCGKLEDAFTFFEQMQERNVVAWTAIIAVYVQQGKPVEALHFFHQLQQEGIKPNKVTFLCMLDACGTLSAMEKAKYGHLCIRNCDLESDVVVCNSLITIYGKCGTLECATKIFENMLQHDLVSWTAMIGVYAQTGRGKEAIELFGKMQQEIDANKVTYISTIDACTRSGLIVEGKRIHFAIVSDGLETDGEIVNALVNMYGKCGRLGDASRMFTSLNEYGEISWTCMIGACAQNGQQHEALRHFIEMQQQGVMPNKVTFISILDVCNGETLLGLSKQMHCRIRECSMASDVTVGNALIKMYGNCNSVESAWRIFDGMDERDVVSWTAMIAVYAQHLKGKLALQLFEQMQYKGLKPNKITFVSALDACASSTALATGEHIHSLILQSSLETDVIISTALVNMYGKCGQLSSACCIFDRMRERNLLSWTAIVVTHAHHGQGQEAVRLFEKMESEGFRADEVTLVSILAACSHSGLVKEGCLFFTRMMKGGAILPKVEHYVCMIDLLGRAGRVKEAEILACDMPYESTTASLMSLLGSCKHQGDVQAGERAARRALDLSDEDSAFYVMLSNIYASMEGEDGTGGFMDGTRCKTSWELLGHGSCGVNTKGVSYPTNC